MTSKNISHKYYELVMLITGAIAALCIISTWISFASQTKASLIFAVIIGSFLVISICTLVVLLFYSKKQDDKKTGGIFAVLGLAHLIFFILVLCLQKLFYRSNSVLALPALHTIIMLTIFAFNIYIWIKNKFTIGSILRKGSTTDSSEANEKPVNNTVESKETKQTSNHKTKIINL